MNLDQLRGFLTVYRCGSITAAAAQLGLAQPTVTAQLKALESEAGPLFERHARGVLPTPLADELAARVAGPLDALESVVLNEGPDPYPTTVHLGGPAEFLCERVLPELADMVAGGLKVRVTFGLTDDLLAAVLAGRLDLAVSTHRPRGRGLTATVLGDEEFVLVASPRWQDVPLADAPLVAYGEDAPIVRRYWRTVFGTRLTRQPELVAPDLRGVLAALRAGAGISVLPTYLCQSALDAGELVLLAEPEISPLNTLFLATRPAALSRRSVAAVYEHLASASLLAESTASGRQR